MNNTLRIFIITVCVLFVTGIITEDAFAKKSKGTTNQSYNEKQVCGDKLCEPDEKMSTEEKTGFYLLSLLKFDESTKIPQGQLSSEDVVQQGLQIKTAGKVIVKDLSKGSKIDKGKIAALTPEKFILASKSIGTLDEKKYNKIIDKTKILSNVDDSKIISTPLISPKTTDKNLDISGQIVTKSGTIYRIWDTQYGGDCEKLKGTWYDNSKTCNFEALHISQTLLIDSGIKVTMNRGFSILYEQNHGARITLSEGSNLVNSGAIETSEIYNSGLLKNYGEIKASTDTLSELPPICNPVFDCPPPKTYGPFQFIISNRGTVINYGNITEISTIPSLINNTGNLKNFKNIQTQLHNYAKIENEGTIRSTIFINKANGFFDNKGTLEILPGYHTLSTNLGNLKNTGYFKLGAISSPIVQFINNHDFYNSGTIENNVVFNNKSPLVNDGLIENYNELSNISTIHNHNQLVNCGKLTNTGKIQGNPVKNCPTDLSISITVDKQRLQIDDTVVYKITVYNHGLNTAKNIKVLDKIPSSLIVLSTTPNISSTTLDLNWFIPSLAVNESTHLEITSKVVVAGTITNIAEIKSFDGDDTNISNNKASAQSQALLPEKIADLSLTKTVDKQEAFVGDTVTFTITVTNNGPSDLYETIEVHDLLPEGFTFESVTPNEFDPRGDNNWIIEGLSVGESKQLQIIGTVEFDGPITNTARIVGTYENILDPDSDFGVDDPNEDDQDSVTVNVLIPDQDSDGDGVNDSVDIDDDNDGISDGIDPAPLDDANNDFNDGTTFGEIISGGQNLTIEDMPGSSVTVNSSGAATIKICGTTTISLDVGVFTFSCGN